MLNLGEDFEILLKNLHKPIVLYNNSSGSNGTITLSDNVSNYEYIEIYFKDASETAGFASVKVYQPNGRKVNLNVMEVNVNSEMWLKTKTILISGTNITNGIIGQGSFTGTTQGVYNASNVIYITRIVGYKA